MFMPCNLVKDPSQINISPWKKNMFASHVGLSSSLFFSSLSIVCYHISYASSAIKGLSSLLLEQQWRLLPKSILIWLSARLLRERVLQRGFISFFGLGSFGVWGEKGDAASSDISRFERLWSNSRIRIFFLLRWTWEQVFLQIQFSLLKKPRTSGGKTR